MTDHRNRHDEDEDEFFGRSLLQGKEEITQRARRIREEEEKLAGFFTEDFGQWHFDTESLCLIHAEGDYVIDLERITSSACILDWIMQVQRKEWADGITIYSLIVAFRRILDPQANYCPFEEERKCDGAILARYYAEKVEEKREETQALIKFRDQANAVLELLEPEKPMPLSLLVESVDFSHEDVLETLRALEAIKVLDFNRETRYIRLTLENIIGIEHVEGCECDLGHVHD